MTKNQCVDKLTTLFDELATLCDAELDHTDHERIAQMVEDANRQAARFAEIEPEPAYLSARQGLAIVGKLLTQLHEPAEAPALLSVDAIGAMLEVSPSTVYRLADGGRMPKPVKIGALVRWSRSEIESWIAAGCKAKARSK